MSTTREVRASEAERFSELLRVEVGPLAEAAKARARALAEAHFGPLPADAALLGEGDVLGRYRIEGLLGVGGQAAVYRAAHLQLSERKVAIKVPHGTKRDRMMREARALAGLSHPGIIGLVDIESADPVPHLVLEYAPNASLQELIESEGALPEANVYRMAKELLEALAYAHRMGVVHRDLKPQNILFDTEGRTRIADFGIGKVVAEELSLSLTGQSRTGLVGTPLYLAPEQERPGAPIDGRTDLYAFGKLLYHMLTGEAPRTVRPVSREREDLDPRWDELIFALTETDPTRRPESADEVLARLEAWRAPAQPPGRAFAPPAPAPPTRSHDAWSPPMPRWWQLQLTRAIAASVLALVWIVQAQSLAIAPQVSGAFAGAWTLLVAALGGLFAFDLVTGRAASPAGAA